MEALAKYGDFELASGMKDCLKTGKWLVFHAGEMLGCCSPLITYYVWALVLETDLAGNWLTSKARYIVNIKSKLKTLIKCRR